MELKTAVMIGLFLGSVMGGYIPTLFGLSLFSFWGLVGNFAGGLLGIFLGYKIGQSIDF